MSLSKECQQRIWILATNVFNSGNDFETYTSKSYLLFKVFEQQSTISNLNENENKTLLNVKKILEEVKKERMHQVIRHQDNINNFKIKCDDLISEIITLIDPEIMIDIPIQEMNF